MKFKIKNTKCKDEAGYRTLYIKNSLEEKINKIAKEHNTSWNNVVISMIETCLTPDDEDELQK